MDNTNLSKFFIAYAYFIKIMQPRQFSIYTEIGFILHKYVVFEIKKVIYLIQ